MRSQQAVSEQDRNAAVPYYMRSLYHLAATQVHAEIVVRTYDALEAERRTLENQLASFHDSSRRVELERHIVELTSRIATSRRLIHMDRGGYLEQAKNNVTKLLSFARKSILFSIESDSWDGEVRGPRAQLAADLAEFVNTTILPCGNLLLGGVLLLESADNVPAAEDIAVPERRSALSAAAGRSTPFSYRADYNLACYETCLISIESRNSVFVDRPEVIEDRAFAALDRSLENAPVRQRSAIAGWARIDPSLIVLRSSDSTRFDEIVGLDAAAKRDHSHDV